MPYTIRRSGTRYKVINRSTGKVRSKGTTKSKAKAQVRLLQAKKHNPDFKPRKK